MNRLLKPSYLVKIQKRDVIKYLPSNIYAIANAAMKHAILDGEQEQT